MGEREDKDIRVPSPSNRWLDRIPLLRQRAQHRFQQRPDRFAIYAEHLGEWGDHVQLQWHQAPCERIGGDRSAFLNHKTPRRSGASLSAGAAVYQYVSLNLSPQTEKSFWVLPPLSWK